MPSAGNRGENELWSRRRDSSYLLAEMQMPIHQDKEIEAKSFKLSIPRKIDGPLEVDLRTGEMLFVLGANGSGKSALIHFLRAQHKKMSRIIAGHRKIILPGDIANLSPAHIRRSEQQIATQEGEQYRFNGDSAGERTNIAIFNLIHADNMRAREIATAFEGGNCELARKLTDQRGPVRRINEIFRVSNLPIELVITNSETLWAKRKEGVTYFAAQLSDGERNVLLIAAEVLTAPPDALLFIDEPELHIHRSIASPLLTQLLAQRPDCAFVVVTHDVMLPVDNPEAKVLLARACSFAPRSAWEVDLIPPGAEIGDDLRRDILGARRTLLFVEGEEESLDKPLYSLLFPQASVIAKSSCSEVERVVKGLRSASNLHWIKPFGVIDRDQRAQKDIDGLREKGIYAVPFVSVEAIYYHPKIQERVAVRQGSVIRKNPKQSLEEAKNKAIDAIKCCADQLVSHVVDAAVRKEASNVLRTELATEGLPRIEITIDVESKRKSEKANLQKLCEAQDFEEILKRYPIRRSAALDRIAKALGFQKVDHYQNLALDILRTDEDALSFARGLFSDLASEIERASDGAKPGEGC